MVAGDSIESLAFGAGLDPGTVWSHPRNAHLREQGRTPRLLLPGDEVFVPAPRLRLESTTVRTRLALRVPARTMRLHVRFLIDENPRSSEAYRLTLDAGAAIEARTDRDGYIDHRIPVLTRLAELRFHADGDDAPYLLLVSHLDPLTTASGLRQRLTNLGHYADHEDVDGALRSAMAAFQSKQGLTVSGKLDAETRSALERVHGA